MKSSTSNSKNELIRGAASLSIAALFVKILGVAYKIPLSHILGDDGMGYFNTAYTVYAFFFLICTAGVPKAITILVTESGANINDSSGSLIKTARRAFILTGITLAIIFTVTSFPIASFIGNRRAAFAMIAIAPSMPFIACSAVYRGYLNGKMRFGVVAVSQFIEAAIKLIIGLSLSWIATYLKLPSEQIAAAAIFGITLGSIITFIQLHMSSKSTITAKNAWQSCVFDKSFLGRLLKISLPITFSSGVISFVNIVDLTVIIRGLKQTGYSENLSTILYGNYTTLAVPMFNFALSIASSVCVSALPILTRLKDKTEKNRFENSLICASDLTAFFALPATILFGCFSREILILLFDYGSVAVGSSLLMLLAPSVTLVAILTLVNTALEAKGGYIVPLLSMSAGGIAKIITSTILVGKAEIGLWGAPIGTAISYLVSILFSFAMYRHRIGRVFSIARPFCLSAICALTAAIPTIAMRSCFSNESLFHSVILLAFYAGIYLLLSFLSGSLPIKRSVNMAK